MQDCSTSADQQSRKLDFYSLSLIEECQKKQRRLILNKYDLGGQRREWPCRWGRMVPHYQQRYFCLIWTLTIVLRDFFDDPTWLVKFVPMDPYRDFVPWNVIRIINITWDRDLLSMFLLFFIILRLVIDQTSNFVIQLLQMEPSWESFWHSDSVNAPYRLICPRFWFKVS